MKTTTITAFLMVLFILTNARSNYRAYKFYQIDTTMIKMKVYDSLGISNKEITMSKYPIQDEPIKGVTMMGIDPNLECQPVKLDEDHKIIVTDIESQCLLIFLITLSIVIILMLTKVLLKLKNISLVIIFMLISLWGNAQKIKTTAPNIIYNDSIDIEGRVPVYIVCRETPKPIKIGVLEIDGETAEAYLKDCYEHPDTVEQYYHGTERINHSGNLKLMEGDTFNLIPLETYEDAQKNAEFKRAAFSTFKKDFLTYYIVPRIPSEQDFIKWKYNLKNK